MTIYDKSLHTRKRFLLEPNVFAFSTSTLLAERTIQNTQSQADNTTTSVHGIYPTNNQDFYGFNIFVLEQSSVIFFHCDDLVDQCIGWLFDHQAIGRVDSSAQLVKTNVLLNPYSASNDFKPEAQTSLNIKLYQSLQ